MYWQKYNCFLQAKGNIVEPYIHEYYKDIYYGELYFEVRDNVPDFDEDIQYTKNVINLTKEKYKINNIFALGISNGGVFCTLLSIHLSEVFKGIISYVGGVGWDEGFYLDFEKVNYHKRISKILFYTGEHDIHLDPCKWGNQIMTDNGFDSNLIIVPNMSHEYLINLEENFLSFFLKI